MARFMVPDRSVPVRWRGALDGLLPEDHLARFIWDVLCDLDFSELELQYPSVQGGPGRSPYHPRVMAALWIFGMCQGLETAAGIAEACRIREDFQWLAGDLDPCDQTLLNFLTRFQDKLSPLWVQVLHTMQKAGLIDLNLVAEDGTKMRANASPRSFLTIDKIGAVIEELQARLDARIKEIAERTAEENDRKSVAEIAALRARLERAKRAETEAKLRIGRRQPGLPKESGDTVGDIPQIVKRTTVRLFAKTEFRRDIERDVLICPAEKELKFIGEYPSDKGCGRYRLYGRQSCTDCPIKTKCTQSARRRVKLPVDPPKEVEVSTPPEKPQDDNIKSDCNNNNSNKKRKQSDPTASLTEPQAAWMLATSCKFWAPCFNADLTVTQGGIIISQFLTNDCTDYHHFAPSLAFVTATLGKPKGWVGDGHYGTAANLIIADREGLELYAPRCGASNNSNTPAAKNPKEKQDPREQQSRQNKEETRFGVGAFSFQPDRNVLLCPAGEELKFVGEYLMENHKGTYRIYGRLHCEQCTLKEKCTRGRGRRIKLAGSMNTLLVAPIVEPQTNGIDVSVPQEVDILRIGRAHEKRMEERGNEVIKLRGCMSETVNAHLKQHGLSRFHVRKMTRCSVILTLACIAHNLMKWAARTGAQEVAQKMNLVA